MSVVIVLMLWDCCDEADVPPALVYYTVAIRTLMIACCARVDDLALTRRIRNEMVIGVL